MMKLKRLCTAAILSVLLVSCGKSNDGDWFVDYKKSFGTSKDQIEKAGGVLAIVVVSKFFDTATIKENNLEIKDTDKVITSKCTIHKINERNGIECISKNVDGNEKKSLSSLYSEGNSLKLASENDKEFTLYLTKTKQDPAEIYKEFLSSLNLKPTNNSETPEQCYERRFKEISAASEKELIADGQKGPFGEAELVPQGVRMGIEEDCASKK